MTLTVNDFRLFRGDLALILDRRQDGKLDIKTIRNVDLEGDLSTMDGVVLTVEAEDLKQLHERKHWALAELFIAHRRYVEADRLVDQTWADVVAKRLALKSYTQPRIAEATA